MFLNGNFVALPKFAETYGVETSPGVYSIQTKWQSALFQSGQCGAFVGVFLAGPVTTRLGYRWTTILALILMNATIFVSFFVSSSPHPPSLVVQLTRLNFLTEVLPLLRPTHSVFSRPANSSKASLGASSLPTLPPTPPRLSLWPFVEPPRPLCR